jgi:hypothetical protein
VSLGSAAAGTAQAPAGLPVAVGVEGAVEGAPPAVGVLGVVGGVAPAGVAATELAVVLGLAESPPPQATNIAKAKQDSGRTAREAKFNEVISQG